MSNKKFVMPKLFQLDDWRNINIKYVQDGQVVVKVFRTLDITHAKIEFDKAKKMDSCTITADLKRGTETYYYSYADGIESLVKKT